MLLVDALHINTGGALMILNHFVDRLVARNVYFVLLKDSRCPRLRSEEDSPRFITMPCDELSRRRYYANHRLDFSAVFCLGNVPPTLRMPCPVHTYIHNVSLLAIPADYPWKMKVKAYIKRAYLRFCARFTDSWIVQTSNTASLVAKYLPTKGKDTLLYPFYFMPEDIKGDTHRARTDYAFIGEYTNAKGHQYLVDAWVKLAERGLHPTLHLTTVAPELKDQLSYAINHGAKIVNHGKIPFSEVLEIYHRSKAIVYPSLNESLGLGIIEGAEAGCDVIGCDLDYLHCVCRPSATFRPQSPDSIAGAIMQYEAGNSPKTVLTIRDMADDLINFLTS